MFHVEVLMNPMIPLLHVALTTAALADEPVDDVPIGSQIGPDEPTVHIDGLHGFRVGYTYINLDMGEQDSLASPHLFTMGYEATQRIGGGDWLSVMLVENVMISGINQSKFIPSANFILGFDMAERIQVGVGPNLTPFGTNKAVHMIAAVGYTPQVGAFHVPIHVSFIPDVDGEWRVAVTTGVNWK
jgi:hypothetical protein